MREFIISDPEYYTKLRMREVQLYLIMFQIRQEERIEINTEELVQAVCNIAGAKATNINYALANLFTLRGKPTNIEYALLNKHLGVSMRLIQKICHKSNVTLYKELENYINEGGYPLKPILSQGIHDDIEKFNKTMIKLFKTASIFLERGRIYD